MINFHETITTIQNDTRDMFELEFIVVPFLKGAGSMIKLRQSSYATLSDIMNAISNGRTGVVNFVSDKEGVFLLSDVVKKVTKKGNTYFSCLVMDRNCSQESRIWAWEDDEPESGQIVLADYSYDKQYGLALKRVKRKIDASAALKREELVQLVDALVPRAKIEVLSVELRELINRVSNRHLKNLLEVLLLSDGEISEKFTKAPAAATNHHVRIGGLLEHSVNLAKMCLEVAAHYEGAVDKDILICGALIHDIGKVYSYHFDDFSFSMTDQGMLEDHIALGLKIITTAARQIDDFPSELEMILSHIIVSHHGLKEWGSTVPPKTLEAIIIQNLDRLDSQVEAFLNTSRSTPRDQSWSKRVPMLETKVFLKQVTKEE